MYMGIQPSELKYLSLQQRADLLEIPQAQENPKEYLKT